ncbi:MAG: sigma-70 family RNA polymerase sigma factor [Bryobacteraceae bacterium]
MEGTGTATVNPAYVYEYQGEAFSAANERARLLSSALSELPERERLTMILRLDEWTLEEISEVLVVSRERVRQLEVRALEFLRAIFERMGIRSLTDIM